MSEHARRLLLVEARHALARDLVEQLGADGYEVSLARSAGHARALAGGARPALALLGGLEDPRGSLALLEEIRAGRGTWDRMLPAIVIGFPARELDLLRAFDAGADDFVGSPPSYLELRARIRALVHRTGNSAEEASLVEVELSRSTRQPTP